MNKILNNIYCPNLIQRKDRRKLMEDKIKEFNLNVKFYPSHQGILYKNIFDKIKSNHFTHENYIACLLTHLNIITNAYENGDEYVTIIEDDVLIHKNINDLALLDIPEYDLLYLGFIPLTDDLSSWNYNIFNDRFINNNVFETKNLWGLYGYSISRKLMKHLIDHYKENMDMELDRYFVNNIQQNEDWKSYGIVPQLIAVRNDSSDLDFQEHNDLEVKSFDDRFAKRGDYI